MKQRRRIHFAGHDHVQSWWLLLAAALAAVLWAIAQVLGWPLWARAVLAGMAAAVPLIVAELQAWLRQRDTRVQLVEQGVVVSGGHGQLPRVREIGLDQLRVHVARVQVPYIERDQQKKLEAAVGPGQAALVVGHSMSGKTRLAAEVVRQKFPEALLLSAESGKALRELIDGGLNPAGLVVWLDDLERFLGTDGVTGGLLNRLITSRAIVVATIRVEQRETYRPRNELRPPEWDVLQRFSEISLQRRLTGPELGRVQATMHDPGVLAAVDHYGLAEYLGAGPEALDKFEKGEIINPVGHALVQAAIDWRRTGLTRPVSGKVLARALTAYLADRPDVLRTNQTIEEGLAWATKRINETVALLCQVFTGSNGSFFEVFDYLVDEHARPSTPVPDSMWDLALKQAEPAELIKIGQAAYLASKLATATTAWRQAAAEAGSVVAASATYNLGVVLKEQGDLEGAKAAYQQAINSGHADIAPMARVNLGNILKEQGGLEGAKAAFQQAINSGHAVQAPMAAQNLADLLVEQGDLEGAKTAWQQASTSKDTVLASLATYNLGVVLMEQGDLEGAKAAWQQASTSKDTEWAPRAANNLGVLLEEQGDLEGAKAAYHQAIASGHADIAPMASLNLGVVLKAQGDLEGAKAAYQQAVDSGHADAAPIAVYNLGVVLQEQGDLEGAKAAYQQAIASGHAERAPKAVYNLGVVLQEQGDLEGAKAAYHQAIASGHAEQAPKAAVNLGGLLLAQGNLEGAKAVYQQAIASGHVEQAPMAAYNLGVVLKAQGDLEGAKTAYQQAIDSGDADVAPLAAQALKRLLRSTPPPAVS